MENNVNQTTAPPETGNQSTPRPVNNKQRSLPIILGVLVLLLVVGSSSYYLGTKNGQSFIPSNNQQTNSQSSFPLPTSTTTQTDTESFTSNELKISFRYPSEIGATHEEPASQGKGGSKVKGEEWWRIDFDKTGFEPGYYEVSASTANYAPEFWESTPHWFNSKITESDTEESVKQKLTSASYEVIKVQKTKNTNNLTAFKVWNLDCYIGCILSRVYIFPNPSTRYNNLQVYTILKILNAGDENATLEDARTLANQELEKIESNQADATTRKYVDGQDLIFNSITFNN